MQVQINTDHNIDGKEALGALVTDGLERDLSRFGDRITRVEVHLSDENGPREGGATKRCVMEARLEGLPPMAVTCDAETVTQAVDGATDKLTRLIEGRLGRLHDQERTPG